MIETTPCVHVCPHTESGFPTLYIVVFCMYNDMRWEVIASFVDIGGIIGYHCLIFLFIILTRHTESMNAPRFNCLFFYFRYILGKTDGDAMKQNRKTSREYVNSTFTNDYANIGKPFPNYIW